MCKGGEVGRGWKSGDIRVGRRVASRFPAWRICRQSFSASLPNNFSLHLRNPDPRMDCISGPSVCGVHAG